VDKPLQGKQPDQLRVVRPERKQSDDELPPSSDAPPPCKLHRPAPPGGGSILPDFRFHDHDGDTTRLGAVSKLFGRHPRGGFFSHLPQIEGRSKALWEGARVLNLDRGAAAGNLMLEVCIGHH
jgi:hypothetical protein